MQQATGGAFSLGDLAKDVLYTWVEKEKADYLADESDDGQVLIDQAVGQAEMSRLEAEHAQNERNLVLLGAGLLLSLGLAAYIIKG